MGGVVCPFQQVEQDEQAIITTCGQFSRVQQPGCTFICCPFQQNAGAVSTRVQSLDLTVACKTKDSVFVDLSTKVQYILLKDKVYEAFYILVKTKPQLTSYVMDVMRSAVAAMELDELFAQKDKIADEVKGGLDAKMEGYGYSVTQILIVDVVPDQGVRDAMNEINKSRRDKEALINKMESQRILIVKAAEAEAESKKLSGMGVARQRKAIIQGFQESVEAFADSGGDQGMQMKDVLELILCTQYFDTLKDMGTSAAKSNCIFLHSNSDSGTNGVRNAMLSTRYA